MSYVIFSIDGGIGKCIAATGVIKAIGEQRSDKKLIVVSGYPDVFLNNPYVHRSYGFGNLSYFYDTYVRDQDCEMFIHNPYNEADHLYKRKHLIEIWCNLYGLEYKPTYLPEVYLTQREVDFYSKNYSNSDKPIMALQTNGGADNQQVKYSWARDIPMCVAEKVVEHFKGKYNIAHIRRQDQLGINGTLPVTAQNYRDAVVLISMTSKRLFMDSFAQHTAAALRMPSTVCWVANSPVVFGYEWNDNILANPFTKKPETRNAYLQEFNIGGDLVEFPYNSETEIFDVDKIIASLEREEVRLIDQNNHKEQENIETLETT